MTLNSNLSSKRKLLFIIWMIIVNVLIMLTITVEINLRQLQKQASRRTFGFKEDIYDIPFGHSEDIVKSLNMKSFSQNDILRKTFFEANSVLGDHKFNSQHKLKPMEIFTPEGQIPRSRITEKDLNLEFLNKNEYLDEKLYAENIIKKDVTKYYTSLEPRRQSENLDDIPFKKVHEENTVDIDGKTIELNLDETVYVPIMDMESVINQATKWLTIKDNEKDDKVNRHQFVYHVNSQLCSKRKIPILIAVTSTVNHTRQRHLIRSTWGSVKTSDSSPTIIFMLGEVFPGNKRLQIEIENESQKYGDIVQGDFVDTYKNLTYKHVMALHWMTSHCDNVGTIVKIDDDVFVDVYKLANFSVTYGSEANCLYCHIIKSGRVQHDGKWALSNREYPFNYFPMYCSGAAYVMSMDVVKGLERASVDFRNFWIDDVYVTGFLAKMARVGLRQLDPRSFGLLGFDDNSTVLNSTTTQGHMFFTGELNWDLLMDLLFHSKY